MQSHPGDECCFHWDLSRRMCFPLCAIPCMPELLWRNACIKIETLLCISDCTYQIQIESSLCTDVQDNTLFQCKFNLHCINIYSSVFHTEFLPMPYKVNLSNGINWHINEAVNKRNRSPTRNLLIQLPGVSAITTLNLTASTKILQNMWTSNCSTSYRCWITTSA